MTLLNQDTVIQTYTLTNLYLTQTFQELSQGLNGIQTYETYKSKPQRLYYYVLVQNQDNIFVIDKVAISFLKFRVRQIDLT
jgi:hypothetical protein